MVVSFLIELIIIVVLLVISYALTPKPKAPKPEAAKDADNPVAEAGMCIPWLFGTVIVKGLNVLDFGDKRISTYDVNV